ncbi:MAG: hypothetical protein EON86_05445 [Brevundimonas sp.]|nr:MAG: hypothetical protein EON86_05445 [Brevundimonas sp.]
MKLTVASAALLLLAGASPVLAQTAPAGAPATDLTRDLNAGPPAAATYLAPTPAPSASPAPVVTPAPATVAPRPAPVTIPRPAAPTPAPVTATPRPATAAPAAAAPRPSSATTAPTAAAPATATPAAPVAEPAPPPPAPNVPTVTVLDATARAALPFSVDLPAGFQIVTGRPGPDFKIYTIRRGERSFAMVYAGPASQFPIYTGEQVQAGGRTSIVATEDGQRHAMEHLFQRADAPREVHVWTMSLDGADRALAEQIAQSVDIR